MTILQRLRHPRADIRIQAKLEMAMNKKLLKEQNSQGAPSALAYAPRPRADKAGTSQPWWAGA